MVWQLILSIALIICSGVIFYLTREISRLQKRKDREPAAPSAIPQ